MRKVLLLFFSLTTVANLLIPPYVHSSPPSSRIRVSGFSDTRGRFAIANQSGGPANNIGELANKTSVLHSKLNGLVNFGFEESSVVKCDINIVNTVNTVTPNSLVDENGTLKVDVFFGNPINTPLSPEEASELARFVKAGGVLYVSGYGWSDAFSKGRGPEYNPLFSELGLGDNFDAAATLIADVVLTATPNLTPVSQGPFGIVDLIEHTSFRKFNQFSLEGVLEYGASGEYLLLESRIGKGYLVVAGAGLYLDDYTGGSKDNLRYYLNLFSLPCRDDWKDNSVVLDVPSFKQGLYGDHPGDPAWEDEAYDNAFKKELKDCDLDTPGVADGTIGECGCALTSTAMVMRYHNIEKGFMGEEINPSTLNGMLNLIIGKAKTPLGYHGGLLRWLGITNLSALSHNRYPIQPKLDYKVDKFSYQRAVELIDSNLPIILKVNGGAHWVVVKGYDPSLERLIINDPAYPDPPGGKYTYLDERYAPASGSSMRLFVPTYSDFRYFQIASEENKVTITDSHGNAIPDLDYLFEENYINPTLSQNLPTGGIHTWTFMLPPDGEFQVEASAPFTVYTSDKEGNLSSKEFDLFGQSTKYRFLYDNETAGESVAQLIDIEVRPFSSNKEINIKSNAAIPVAILSSESFDVSTSKASFIGFGQTGNEQSLHKCQEKLVDVNGDGLMDRLCWFKVGEMNLNNSSKEAKLMLQDNENLYISIHTL